VTVIPNILTSNKVQSANLKDDFVILFSSNMVLHDCDVLGCVAGGVFGKIEGIIGEGSGYHVNMPETCRSRALCHIL